MTTNNTLIPPDLKRCQGESRATHSFMTLGPPPRMERCTKKPRWLATDGVGSMSLCSACKAVCEKQMPEATFKPITTTKKVYSTENREGPDLAAKGQWWVTGPGIDALFFKDRTHAKIVERALNQAYAAGASPGEVTVTTKQR